MKYEEYLKTNKEIIEPIEDILCDIISIKSMGVIIRNINNDEVRFKLSDYLEEILKKLGEKEIK